MLTLTKLNNHFLEKLFTNKHNRVTTLPRKESCRQFLDDLFSFLFECDISDESINKLQQLYIKVEQQFNQLIYNLVDDESEKKQHSEKFFNAVPAVYDLLLKDAEAILANDPAAKSLEEVLIAYPGFFATVVYRFAHQLHLQGLHTLARFISEYAHSKTGIDIHPAAQIGDAFVIDHGTGVVIGETSVIGNHVTIYQGVTLGALNVSKDKASTKRHPTIEDHVVIYAGATILGGSTVIGKGSIIGGNVWLTYSVPPASVVYHKSEIHVKDNNPFPEPINYVI